MGVVSVDWLRCHPDEVARAGAAAELVNLDYVLVDPTETIFDLLVHVQRERAAVAVVVDPETATRTVSITPKSHVLGVITKADLTEAIAEGLELFED